MVALVSGTNLDVNTLVSQLMAAERAPLTAMKRTQTQFETRISAFGRLSAALAPLADAARKLELADTFRPAKAALAASAVAQVSAGPAAQTGIYSLEVSTLAQPTKLASSAYFSADAVVGTGNLNIQFGTFAAGVFTANGERPAVDVAIGAGNNTLAGIRDAINQANAGVRASIVNDGSGYRLSLTGPEGAANSLRITVTDSDGGNTDTTGLSQLAFNPAAAVGAGRNLTQNQAAQDALLVVDGIPISKPSNTVTDAIAGVTLNLTATNAGSPTTLTVTRDGEAVKTALEAFVKAHNDLHKTARDLTFYDAAARNGGALQGDAAARALQSQVRAALTSTIGGLTGSPSRLSEVGLSLQRDGTLALDGAKLNQALANPAFDLGPLFGPAGRSADARMRFTAAAGDTPTGDYSVNVTQAATRGALAATAAANLTISAGVNDRLDLSVDGRAVSITLGAATYASADALAAEVQSRINGAQVMRDNGAAVLVTQAAGVLTIRSASFGSASSVTGASGNAATDLLGGAGTASAGADVAGTINGVAATGGGQVLAAANGLRITVTADAAANLGTLTFTRGHAAVLRNAIEAMTAQSGTIGARTTGLASSVKRVVAQQEAFENRMGSLEKRYRAQFSALDSMLARMNTTSSFLSQQLAGLAAQSSDRR
ncbi:MAG: flagellar filament capping protein FliD [Burkholderiales bacterium]|nr:flagellar filament capping protein FliD [Burkholderiales bacterium]